MTIIGFGIFLIGFAVNDLGVQRPVGGFAMLVGGIMVALSPLIH